MAVADTLSAIHFNNIVIIYYIIIIIVVNGSKSSIDCYQILFATGYNKYLCLFFVFYIYIDICFWKPVKLSL